MEPTLNDMMNSISEIMGLSTTLYDLAGYLREAGYASIPLERRIHTHPFCLKTKGSQEARCVRCDNQELFPLCLEKKSPFTRICHAGASEIIIPLIQNEELIALAFLGPFEPAPGSSRRGLPILTTEESDKALHLGILIQCYLGQKVKESREKRSSSSREAAIRVFIRNGISRDLQLCDLAAYLNLSPSRTRHLVKEECGGSFRKIRDELRVEVASELLRTSNSRLNFIARQAGFSDPDYFSRFFRKMTGQSPGRFRRKVPV